jgi:hypothetical protein
VVEGRKDLEGTLRETTIVGNERINYEGSKGRPWESAWKGDSLGGEPFGEMAFRLAIVARKWPSDFNGVHDPFW